VTCGFLDVAQRDTSIQLVVMKECLRLCGLIRLAIPARLARRLTIRSAAWRSIRPPFAPKRIGPVVRSPRYRSKAREVRGASGIVTRLPPLRTILRARGPRSQSRSSASAPRASAIRSPLSANNEAKA